MDSPGFVWLLSHSSWFCLASTTRLIQIRNGTEHRILSIYFWTLCMDSLLVCLASFPQLLVLFGFHNSLNINPKRSGTSDFILSWFVQLFSHSSWFCAAFFPQLLVLCGFFPTAPSFVRLPQLDYTNPKRSGTSDFILTFVQEQLSVSYGTRTSIES